MLYSQPWSVKALPGQEETHPCLHIPLCPQQLPLDRTLDLADLGVGRVTRSSQPPASASQPLSGAEEKGATIYDLGSLHSTGPTYQPHTPKRRALSSTTEVR